jgi:hypothetical protein
MKKGFLKMWINLIFSFILEGFKIVFYALRSKNELFINF